MDIFEKSLEIWNKVTDRVSFSYENKFIFDNEYIGHENNCLSSVPKSVYLLDGELNQLHILKNKKDVIFHQTVLMTPQPLEKFTKMEMSTSKLFMALIGEDSISLIELCSLSSLPQTCKKIKEIFISKDKIIDVKWYPNMHDYLVILTKQSINIYHILSDLTFSCIYQFNLYEEVDCHSKSFGIKEEYIGCDFGNVQTNIDDNNLFILKDSGEVFLLPELRIIKNNKTITPLKLLFDPPASDNYQDNFISIIVLRGVINVLVLANRYGTVQHALFLNNKICVYEIISVQMPLESANKSVMHLQPDDTAYPPRYFLIHAHGIQSCILPWAVRLRLSMKSHSQNDLERYLNSSENIIFDNVLKTNVADINNQSQVRFGGITVVRGPSVPPELVVFQYREKKMLVKLKLRQESSLMLKESHDSGDKDTILTSRDYSSRELSESKFLMAFKAALGNARRLPILASGIGSKDTTEKDKLFLVLQMNEIAGEYGAGLASAGKIFEHRLNQITSVVGLQKEQLITIRDSVADMKKQTNQILGRYERAISRQQNLLTRLSDCSHRVAEINGVSTRADKEAILTITNVYKRLASLQALMRSCKLRFSQSEDFIDEFQKRSDEYTDGGELMRPVTDKYQMVLRQADYDINRLIVDVRALMKR